MKNIYIVLGVTNYEAQDILGVYLNRQKAEKYKKTIKQNGYKYNVFMGNEKINHTITYDNVIIEEHQAL